MLGPHCGGVCQVEVALTLLKLTETDRQQADRQTGGRAQVSIGMHAHPKNGFDIYTISPFFAMLYAMTLITSMALQLVNFIFS